MVHGGEWGSHKAGTQRWKDPWVVVCESWWGNGKLLAVMVCARIREDKYSGSIVETTTTTRAGEEGRAIRTMAISSLACVAVIAVLIAVIRSSKAPAWRTQCSTLRACVCACVCMCVCARARAICKCI